MKYNMLLPEDGKERLRRGLERAASVVISTMGPGGRNVLIDVMGRPMSTKDGVTVSKYLRWEDRIEALASHMLIDAANKTVEQVGDGTTTCCRLVLSMYQEGLKLEDNAFDVVQSIKKTSEEVCKSLESMAKKVDSKEELIKVTTVSANNDKELGEIVGSAVWELGYDGIALIEDSDEVKSSYDIESGYSFSSGLYTKEFYNKGVNAEFEKPVIVVMDDAIELMEDFAPIWEHYFELYVNRGKSNPLLLIATDVSGDPLASIIATAKKYPGRIGVVRSPQSGVRRKEMLSDIAFVCNTEVYGKTSGRPIEDFRGNFGTCKKVVATTSTTSIVYEGRDTSELIRVIRDDNLPEDFKNERIAKLSSGIATIKVGGVSKVEREQRKQLVDDAQGAAFAALDGGVIPGAGTALYVIGEKHDISFWNVVLTACAKQILINRYGKVLVNYLPDSNKNSAVFNSKVGKWVESHDDPDYVWDPVNVTIAALRNATSVITQLLTIDNILEIKPIE